MSLKANVNIEVSTIVIITAVFLYYVWRGLKQGIFPKVRDFAAVDAIKEGCERAAEEGKMVIVYPAATGLTSSNATMTYAYLQFLRYTAEEAAKRGVVIRAPVPVHDLLPIISSTVTEAYMKAGRPEMYDPEMCEYYAAGYNEAIIGMLADKPGASMLTCIGTGSAGTTSPLGAARQHNALTVGGCLRWTGMYQVALICDYIMIGDETYAAGDKIASDAKGLAVDGAGDILKMAVMAIGGLAILLGLVGFTDFINWMKM